MDANKSGIDKTESESSFSSDGMATDISSDSMATDSSESDCNSSDSMSLTSDCDSSDSMSLTSDCDSSDSMSLTSEDTTSTTEDSSSDYLPSEESDPEPEPKSKKRKRNMYDTFCLYEIRPNNPEDTNLYIGSSINFNRRKVQHKKASTNKRGGTYYSMLYRYIRKCGGWDNFTMTKILDYPCETKQEGLLKEREYILSHNATLNSVMPIKELV